MPEHTAEFAIVGAGPAGAHLASRLAAADREVLLFDPKGAWEKPCGGGVPTRALKEFSFILESAPYPKKLIRRVRLISASGRSVGIDIDYPFAIFSREVLNRLVLDRAIDAGSRFIQAAVTEFCRQEDVWHIATDDGRTFQARFLIGADGAASPTRRKLVGIFPKQDLALAFGYNITVEEVDSPPRGKEEAVVYFPPQFTGYIWAFPRPGVMNFGIASKLGAKTSAELRDLLTEFVGRYYGGAMPDEGRMNFFGAKIPTLDAASWKSLRATGDGWALVGDAAGFSDPITGEGIYYAFRSANLLADTLLQAPYKRSGSDETTRDWSQAALSYEREWREGFGRDLEKASHQLPLFYHGRFLGAPFANAVIFLATYHKGVRTVLIKALLGEQSYVTLKRDLLRHAYQVF